MLVFLGVSVGATSVIAVPSASMEWTVRSPAWAALAPLAMWAPALARFVVRRTVDRDFTSTLPLDRWGVTGAQGVLWPLLLPLVVYGMAYTMAWSAGLAQWSPGGGLWKTGTQVAVNVLLNLSILAVVGTFTALGEEIGWRGYLQPRLDAAGVGNSVVLVALAWTAFHTPIIIGAGYNDVGSLWRSIGLSAALDLSLAFIWAHESYRAGSLWPAVFFHSFHNTISQWLFPKFFAGGENEFWLGEGGLLPLAGYVAVGVTLLVWMHSRGRSWQTLARDVLDSRNEAEDH